MTTKIDSPVQALARAFGPEWSQLSPEQRSMIEDDYLDAGCSVSEYAARIGDGNATSYALCLAAAKRRADREQAAAELNANTQ